MPTRTHAAAAALLALLIGSALLVPGNPAAARRAHAESQTPAAPPQSAAALEGSVSQQQFSRLAQPYLVGTYPHPRSRYAVLMDMDTGKLIYAMNPDAHREPASLTKIMAATVLIERGRLSDTVVAPPQVAGVPDSSLHLRPGERISLEDLLYAMLLRSANDTPIAGGVYLCGSVPAFVAAMNAKAQSIGCVNTHFVTPNGLYNPLHYSTARDIGLMARYAALNLPLFDEIVKTQKYRIHRSIDVSDTLVVNTSSTYLKNFPGADGIKTGYISQAGHCFVGSSTRGGWRLLAVALDSSLCREDVMGMLSYGFAHFQPLPVIAPGTPEGSVTLPGAARAVPVATGGALGDVVSKDRPAPAPSDYTVTVAPLPGIDGSAAVHAGDKVGVATLLYQGKLVSQTDAVALSDAAALPRGALGWMVPLSRFARVAGKIAGIVAAAIAAIAFAALCALKIYAGALTKTTRRRRDGLTTGVRAMD